MQRIDMDLARFGLPRVDEDTILADEIAAWEAVDTALARELADAARALPPATRRFVVNLLEIEASGQLADSRERDWFRRTLARELPGALPLVVLALRRHPGTTEAIELLSDRGHSDEVLLSWFSLLEAPGPQTAARLGSVARGVVRAGSLEPDGESRLLLLLDSFSELVRAAVAEGMLDGMPLRDDRDPTEAEERRFPSWFAAIFGRAADPAVFPAFARAAAGRRVQAAIPELERRLAEGPEDLAILAALTLARIDPSRAGGDSPAALRGLLRDGGAPIEQRCRALELLVHMKDREGRRAFGDSAQEKVARDSALPFELRKRAYQYIRREVPYGDPLHAELDRAAAPRVGGLRCVRGDAAMDLDSRWPAELDGLGLLDPMAAAPDLDRWMKRALVRARVSAPEEAPEEVREAWRELSAVDRGATSPRGIPAYKWASGPGWIVNADEAATIAAALGPHHPLGKFASGGPFEVRDKGSSGNP